MMQTKLDHINVTILIIPYGPNDNAEKEEKDEFYQTLQTELDNVVENKLLMGDTGLLTYYKGLSHRSWRCNPTQILDVPPASQR
jgi:exonuclease III